MSKTNDVVIFHVQDGEKWARYLQSLFSTNKLMRTKVINLDKLEYENPPEVTLAVQDSYLVVLLAITDSLVSYMKNKQAWFRDVLVTKLDTSTSVVVGLCDVESSVFVEDIGDCYESSSSWKHFTFGQEQKANLSNVSQMLGIVDQNDLNPQPMQMKTQHREKKRKSSVTAVIPSKVYREHEEVVVVFNDVITGLIQVSFNDRTKIDTTKLNPYTVKFKVTATSPNKQTLRVLSDGTVIHKCVFYFVAPHRTAFTSIGHLCQILNCANTEELDKTLVDTLERSIPGDGSLAQLYNLVKSSTGGLAKSDDTYPTLLHFAAANGLSEFCSLLLDVPGSVQAYQIENCEGFDPADLAHFHHYSELAEYIRDYMETAYVASELEEIYMDICEYSNVKITKPEDNYMSMNTGLGRTADEDAFVVPGQLNPRAKSSELPPVPQKYRRYSVPERGNSPHRRPTIPSKPSSHISGLTEQAEASKQNIISPAQLMGMSLKDKEIAEQTPLTGSASQNELLEIMERVKVGDFDQNEAVMMFKTWQNINKQSLSFKQRQESLMAMRKDYKEALNTVQNHPSQVIKKKNSIFNKFLNKKTKFPKNIPEISEPFKIRASTRKSGTPSTVTDSMISTTSSSSSSSRDSRGSAYNTLLCSSDEDERQSRQQTFLEDTYFLESEVPPLPPRTYTRANMNKPIPVPRPKLPPRR